MQDGAWIDRIMETHGEEKLGSAIIAGNNRKGSTYKDGATLREVWEGKQPGHSFFLMPTSFMTHAWQSGEFPIPDALKGIHRKGPYLSLGQKNQSNRFHQHDHNWFAQVKGSKRWFAIAPDDKSELDDFPLEEVDQNICNDKRLRPLPRCDLQPGQVAYVPSQFYHATCVLQEQSVAIAFIGSPSLHPPIHQQDVELCVDAKLGNLSLANFDIKAKPRLSQELLKIAAGGGHIEVLKALVEHRADMQAVESGRPLLVSAAEGGHVSVMKYLVSSLKWKPKGEDNQETSLLNIAASEGHLPIALFLEAQGMKANGKYKHGFSPIMAAASGGHMSVLQHFASQDVDLTRHDSSGMSALHGAAIHEYYYIIEYLHREHDLNLQELRSFAEKYHQQPIVQFLQTLQPKNRKRRKKSPRKSAEL